MRGSKLHHVNTALFLATVTLLLYVILAPLLPVLVFWVEQRGGQRLAELSAQLAAPNQAAHAATGDRIVIPAMLLDTEIHEGADLRALRGGGTWHRPHTGTPDSGGNTVIVAHRYTYSNPHGTFYFLNKLRIGDRIGLFWHGKRYIYRTTSVRVVPPTDTAVETPTAQAQLTLYTCTPLWLPKDRLVIVASLEEHS